MTKKLHDEARVVVDCICGCRGLHMLCTSISIITCMHTYLLAYVLLHIHECIHTDRYIVE